MDKEIEDEIELEKMKMQSAALASHPATQGDFLKKLFEFDEEENEQEFDERNVEWLTPQTEEELEELNRYLDSI